MKNGYKECPYCGEDIKAGAIKCRYCGEFLNDIEKDIYINNTLSTKKIEDLSLGQTTICPFCKNKIKEGVIKCQHCGEFLNENKKKVESYRQGNNNRMRRGIFFRNMTILFLVEFAILFIIGWMGASDDAIDGFAVFISLVAIFAFQVPRTIKRCHDIGWSGWWTLLFILPLLCLLMYIIPGTDGDNKYGPKPN